MNKMWLTIIIALLIIPVYVVAVSWDVNITVNAQVSSERDLFALRDSIETAVNGSLENVSFKFNTLMKDSTWSVQIDILGNKKLETDMDDFSLLIYNYFTGKFTPIDSTITNQLEVEYRTKVIW